MLNISEGHFEYREWILCLKIVFIGLALMQDTLVGLQNVQKHLRQIL